LGALTVSNLTLTAGCTNVFHLGARGASDTVQVNGSLIWGGTFEIECQPGFVAGDYTLITCTGTIATNGTPLLTMPPGCRGSLRSETNSIVLRVTGAGGTLLKVD
jgi:hypothetical protein